jgi:diadenosine tetraphosphatase ApaH/serine/threonine PP2A family protein phosphatase
MEAFEVVLAKYAPLLDSMPEPLDPTMTPPLIDLPVLEDLCKCAVAVLSNGKALISLPEPILIVGDVHGNIADLIRILRIFPDYSSSLTLLFLGDYVDRGVHSVAVITLLLALLCKYPSQVFLLRGNHEFSHINRVYGFYDEVIFLYHSESLWSLFQKVFAYLPLAATVSSKLFCVHGGLSPDLRTLDQIAQLPLPIVDYFSNPMIADLVWSDPNDTIATFENNHRGSGVLFGTTAVRQFLADAGLRALVRAHQCVVDGCMLFAQNCGVTVFSSSEYSRIQPNRAGVVRLPGNGRVELLSLPAAGKNEIIRMTMGFGNGVGLRRMLVRPAPAMQREAGQGGQPVKPRIPERGSGRRRSKAPAKAPSQQSRVTLGKIPAIPSDENAEAQANA